jgi:hypothetical protein
VAGNPFGNKGGGAAATATKPRSGGLATANGDEEPTSAKGTGPKRDPFATAGGGGAEYKIREFLGELLLVKPIEVDTMQTTISPESEFCRVDVIRLDNENEKVEDLLVFQTALLRTLKRVLRSDDEWVLGRLELGQEKKGKNAPYILTAPTEEDVARARAVMTELGL